MAKDLAVKKQELPAEYIGKDGTPIGTENIDADDMILPRIRIIQPTSQDSEDGLGKLKNSVTEEVVDKLILIPLTVKKGRVFFPPNETHSAPDCRSTNGITGNDGNLCEECEFARWSEVPPECAETRDFPVMLEDGSLAGISLKRSAIREAKKLITAIKMKGIPFFFVKVTLSTVKAESSKGVYYLPVIKITGLTNDEERKEGLALLKFLQEKHVDIDQGKNPEE